MTQTKLLSGCFALMTIVNAFMSFANFFNYVNFSLAVLCGIAAYKIYKTE